MPSLLQDYCTNNPDEICRIAACQSKVNEVRNVMVSCQSKEGWASSTIEVHFLKAVHGSGLCCNGSSRGANVGELHTLYHRNGMN